MGDVESDLRDMMNRLRFAAGKIEAAPVQEVVVPHIDEKCLLIIQRALCHHPALASLHSAREELKKELMIQLQDTLRADIVPVDDIGRMLTWMNEVSEALEMERLSAVFIEPERVLSEVQQKTLDELGVEMLPRLSQHKPGELSPWDVLFSLVTGPLFHIDESQQKRVEIHIPNPTAARINDLVDINNNIYCVSSWKSLLNSLDEYPINMVRHVWHAATFFFPTCGPVVVSYLRKEIHEISKGRHLWDERHEDDAKETYRSYCRVMNCFFRHLPLCFSVELYRMFFDFLETYIRPDDIGLENVFRSALQRDIGHCPGSTDIWKKFLRWKGDKIPDTFQRREWVRKVYIRMLRTPLHDLQEVKEDYEYFLKKEYRGRPPSEGHVEERFLRARAAASELGKLLWTVGGCSSFSSSGRDALTRASYLPHPVRINVNGGQSSVSEKDDSTRRSEIEVWQQWSSLIEWEISTSAYAGIELFGYERIRFFMAMRTSFFPHEAFCWINYVDHCLEKQPLLSEGERRAMAAEVLERASFLLPKNLFMRIAHCDYMLNGLGEPECAHRTMKELLLQQRQLAVDFIKGSFSDTTMVVKALENVALLSINWMRWGSISREVTNTQFTRLVARFTMHRVDFLSLIMGVVRRASREDKTFTPRRSQQAFNTFCHHWIRLELIRNGALKEALLILERWKDHLKMFVGSARDRDWSMIDCGVDEYFTSSCGDICQSDGSVAPQVVDILEDLSQMISSLNPVATGDGPALFSFRSADLLTQQVENIRSSFFVESKGAKSLLPYFKLPLDLVSSRIYGSTVPLQTYDNPLFTAEWTGLEEASSFYISSAYGGGEKVGVPLASLQCPIAAMPDDAAWIVYKAANHSSNPTSGRVDSRRRDGAIVVEQKSKKINRPPNRRALVARSVHLKGLPLALQSTEGAAAAVATALPDMGKVEKMLTEALPTVYETDSLFKDVSVDTEWLLGVLQNMAALRP
uniref:Uncharacterized protein TCIL3000_11_16160 n=1 Tax=Trypanosoma congolense (strain IL3000) TaxID=1068625 RepID=G0V383_TRYCI|nr:unnamed protein product [Trypanosoma congolense IL3000]